MTLTPLILPSLLLATTLFASPSSSPAEKPYFEDNFQNLDNWQPEGPFTPTLEKNTLHLKTSDSKTQVGQFLWCKKELPTDYKIEFDLTPASDSGFFLIFFSVSGTKGEDILASELFEKYLPWNNWTLNQDWDKYTSPPNRKHDSRIQGYHISYRRNELANCNLRKNPGLTLLKSADIKTLLPKNKPAHVSLTKIAGHITLTVNNQPFMDYTDEKTPYTKGRFGFRQVYDSEGSYQNLKIYDLTKK